MKDPRQKKAVEALISAGAQLSNIAYNCAQKDEYKPEVRSTMDECRRKWDAALTEFRKLFPARPQKKKPTTPRRPAK